MKNGKGFHVVHDTAMGNSVMEYAKEHVYLEKAQLIRWIQNLVEQLEHYYKSGYTQAYGHINPYSIIIADNNEVLLLDASAEENNMWLGKMQKKKIREIFVRKEHVLSIKTDIMDDIYGLGQMVQFILDKCKTEGKYSIRERQTIKKIRRCCVQSDMEPREALKEVGRLCQKLTIKERKKVGIELQMAAVIIVLLGIAGSVLWESNIIKDNKVDNLQAKLEYANEQKEELDKEKQTIHKELGLLYWIELKNEEEGMKHLEYAKESYKEAEQYIKIHSYMNRVSLSEKDKEDLWKLVDDTINYMDIQVGYLEYMPFIRALEKIDTVQSWYKIKELAEAIKENRQWGKTDDAEEKRIEILEYLKKAYEKIGDKEMVDEVYKELDLLKAS